MSRSTRTRPPIPKTSKREFSRRAFFGAALGATLTPGALAPNGLARAFQTAPAITSTDLGGVFLFQGAGSNVLAIRGDGAALMVDGGSASDAGALLTAVREATGTSRIDTLINTHWHPEQTGANVAVGSAGGVIFAHEKTALSLSNTIYSSIAFEGRLEPLPEAGRPNRTTRGDGSMEFGGRRIDYGYLPAAHTDGDLYVHFPESNVLAAGGVVSGEEWPLVDYHNGAWFGGRVRGLEWLAELVNPETRVVPAHGRLLTGSEIVSQRDIYQELFQTMIGYMNMGFGPEDAARENPLSGYTSEYGDASDFLYGAYRSMLIAYVPD